MKRGSDGEEVVEANSDGSNVAFCSSCDRCRLRKTKCDGKKPCNNCVAKFMKKSKSSSTEGFDIAEFECVYSPAKRRGPVPGRVNQPKKSHEISHGTPLAMTGMDPTTATMNMMQHQANLFSGQFDSTRMMMLQQQATMGGPSGGFPSGMDSFGAQNLLQVDPMVTMMQALQGKMSTSENTSDEIRIDQPSSRRARTEIERNVPSTPDTVAAHNHLTHQDDSDGNRLRAYYQLSVDELFCLPCIPSDNDCAHRLNLINSQMLPPSHQVALQSARFTEIAIGALVHNEISLATELCNATVHCLRQCVKEPVQPQYVFEVGRSYFLLGVFRAFRGDMDRYFKYRRVALIYIAQIASGNGSEQLLAAMAYVDSWAYMIFNANESELPNIDKVIPQVSGCSSVRAPTSDIERRYNTCCSPAGIASDRKNQMWIQGVPSVYLNTAAPLTARSLDALAFAIRSCCDQANSRFSQLSQGADDGLDALLEMTVSPIVTPTSTAVLSHEDELCSRNMVLSAYTLLQEYESTTGGTHKKQGHRLIISAMDAFLENGDEDGSEGFTDSQIQSLLSVCNITIENPLLLHHGGPTYHMVSNAAILLCHLLNGMHAHGAQSASKEMEAAVFEEILDTFLSIRKLLSIHRRKLPAKLRCHGIPRPSIEGPKEGRPFIDLCDTLMCVCRGCQGFVLMACSPCVAAERARSAAHDREMEILREEQGAEEAGELDRALLDLESEFVMDDDDLISILSSILTT